MAKSAEIRVPDFKLEQSTINLIGTAPLIVHAFHEKQRKAMLDRQMKVAQGGRDARDPVAEYGAAMYILPDERHGFPAVAFKNAAVTACTSLADVTKVAARQAFRVRGISMNAPGVLTNAFVRTALVPLITTGPTMREDVIRLSGPGRTPEMRYRPEYEHWAVELDIELNRQVISQSQLESMFQAAGHGVGVGDYRSERDGDCGFFRVANAVELTAWRAEHGL